MLLLSASQIKSTFDQGMQAMSERRFTEAVRHFRQVISAAPDHAEALFHLGRILIAGDRASRAIEGLVRATEVRPEQPAIWQALAEAIALGGDAAQEADFVARLARARIAVNERIALQDRFGALRKGSRPQGGGLSPRDMKALVGLISAGNFPAAEAQATAVLKRFENSAFALNILASAQAAQGKTVAARANYIKSTRVDPKYTEAFENLGRMLLQDGQNVDAATALRRAVILAPGRVPALVGLAEALTRTNEATAALPLLLRADREEPNSAKVLTALGNAYARLNMNDESEAAFLRVAALTGTGMPLEARTALAMAQSRNGKDEEALANLEIVLAEQPDNPVALGGKASVLQTLGRFDEAEPLFRRTAELDPLNGETYRQMLASHTTRPDDPILGTMLELYEGAQLTDASRMNLAFAISKALEDVKDYGRVFRYLDDANALVRKTLPFHRAQRDREIARLKEAFDGFDYHGTTIAGTSDFAPIFVTGMPRSGTTLVEQIISSHSTVEGAGELSKASVGARDLLFPGGKPTTLASIAPADIAHLGHDYQAYIAERFPGAARITDKAIGTYLYIGLIRLALPNARFIVVRRDPRDTLLSIYKNKFPEGTHPYAYDQIDLAHYYGSFVEMVDFWRERVPDWFYEVHYENLVADPETETRRLIAACGLDWEDACLSFHENKRKVQTLSIYQVRQPISKGSVRAWQRYEKDLAPMLELLREAGHITD